MLGKSAVSVMVAMLDRLEGLPPLCPLDNVSKYSLFAVAYSGAFAPVARTGSFRTLFRWLYHVARSGDLR